MLNTFIECLVWNRDVLMQTHFPISLRCWEGRGEYLHIIIIVSELLDGKGCTHVPIHMHVDVLSLSVLSMCTIGTLGQTWGVPMY